MFAFVGSTVVQKTYRAAFIGPEKARSHIPEDPIEGDHLIQYSHEAPQVFLGHFGSTPMSQGYWHQTLPAVILRAADSFN